MPRSGLHAAEWLAPETESQEKTGDKAAEMSGHADVWGNQIKGNLHQHNNDQVPQSLPRLEP